MQATPQATPHRTTKPFSLSSPNFVQRSLPAVLEWVQTAIPVAGAGLMIAAVLGFQQFLLQVYAARWQLALLFVLIGLMVALLLGHYRLEQSLKTATAVHWTMWSSLTVTLLGIGSVICILSTAPPLN